MKQVIEEFYVNCKVSYTRVLQELQNMLKNSFTRVVK